MNLAAILFLLPLAAFAAGEEHSHSHHQPAPIVTAEPPLPSSAARCTDMEVWDYSMNMCMPFPMAGMPMRMVMLHGNAFLNQTFASGPRGKDGFSVPNMFMADIGQSIGDRHYLNLEFMGTAEKWTLPRGGYPLLLQIGEENADHQPYIDAQHPHSSPIMGLTLSDTIALGRGRDHVKVFFSPRGAATDGPIAFMHRPTGQVNPDAPLGHHIGQDVSHISSTVIGASLRLGNTNLEASTFNGEEPEPTKVDLPLGTPNSYAARVTQEIKPRVFVMASAAYVKEPEAHGSHGPDHIWRYSASLYRNNYPSGHGWILHDSLIWGMIRNYDHASVLHSIGKEFWVHRGDSNIWGRIELLQRTPAQLMLSNVADMHRGRWVGALTLGYTHKIARWDNADVGLGGSFTQNWLPSSYRGAYGGNPYTGKIFLQLSGMKMWDIL